MGLGREQHTRNGDRTNALHGGVQRDAHLPHFLVTISSGSPVLSTKVLWRAHPDNWEMKVNFFPALRAHWLALCASMRCLLQWPYYSKTAGASPVQLFNFSLVGEDYVCSTIGWYCGMHVCIVYANIIVPFDIWSMNKPNMYYNV